MREEPAATTKQHNVANGHGRRLQRSNEQDVARPNRRQHARPRRELVEDALDLRGRQLAVIIEIAMHASFIAQVDVLWSDVSALPGWRARASLVREHLFPPVAYMRSHYTSWPATALPLAYLQRIVLGAPKWFRRSGPGALL